MRIARFTTGDEPQYGIVQESRGEQVIHGLVGDPLYTEIRASGQSVPLEDVRLLAPVIPRSKVIGVGRNYAEHAAELGHDVPDMPLFFLKPNTAVVGPGDPIVLPRWAAEVQLEAELAVVIKSVAKDISVDRASEVILGYTCANDVSARNMQRAESQWFRGKAFDTSCPLGPWIETDVDPNSLAISSAVDETPAQSSSTAKMLHSAASLVAEASTVSTLLPGDVILTGTPAGVADIEDGQTAAITIEDIGTLSNPVVRREKKAS